MKENETKRLKGLSKQQGAKASAIIYSIIETAKGNNLKPINYLTYIFEKLSNMDFKNNPEILMNLLPWSNNLPENCRQLNKDIENSTL